MTSPDPIHSKSAAMLEKLKKLENGPSLEGVKAGEYITHKKAENEQKRDGAKQEILAKIFYKDKALKKRALL